MTLAEASPEKAGVGGSTPSLATHWYLRHQGVRQSRNSRPSSPEVKEGRGLGTHEFHTGLNAKHVKGSLSNLSNLGAQLGVIVIGHANLDTLAAQFASTNKAAISTWPVAVEKVRFSQNRRKMDDRKCIRGRRKSLIGHPSATFFQRDLRERVFQQLRLLSPMIVAHIQATE